MTSATDQLRRTAGRTRLAALLVLTAVVGLATSTALSAASPSAGTVAAGDGRADRPTSLLPRIGEDLLGSGHPRAATGTYVAVGDSITAGVPAEGTVQDPGPTSWLADPRVVPGRLVGGWARSGAITDDMRAAVVPTPADVLVLLGGTNDLARGLPWSETADDLRAVADVVGARTVLLVATPPSTATPAARTAFNARLARLAAAEGWHHVDPWTAVASAGAFTAGSSDDGIHPTPAAARSAGRVIGAELGTLYRRS